ncbi:methyl-accepting chemotaxis protein [Azospirillum sp. SYSU D00513]|uniref:methyl-accepting chemotaxis protein n=1 Tax=Azospirillum sp. SYSU D00513 TaxID=2812561 RepID=UPI001A969191|nr:methyl-accepting chemotaxis protein [Azospirillum sp. SYSU D00513]
MRVTVKVTLLSVLALLGGLLTLSSLVGMRALGTANEGLRTVYEDRVVPLRDLKIVSDAYAVFVVDASHKVRNGNFQWAEGAASVAKAREDIRRHWNSYLGTRMTGEEAALIGQLKPLTEGADAAVDKLATILDRKDAPALDRFVREDLYRIIDPVTERISALIDFQVTSAATAFAEAQRAHGRAERTGWILLALALAMAVGGGYAVIARVVRPVGDLTRAMERLAGGDLTADVPRTGAGDEIGAMARAVEVFKANGLENAALRARQEQERAAAEAAKRQALEEMAATVERETHAAADRVTERTCRMEADAGAMLASAGSVGVNSQSVAAAADQALRNAQTVSAAAGQLAQSIAEIGERVSRAGDISRQAVGSGQHARAAIESLSRTVTRIGDVAALIQEIASQTNLLALNATIEAARAGEAGKGFAVVAGEVKSLAGQTAKATEDISSQIAEIQAATRSAVAAVDGIGRSIGEVDHVASSIAAAVEEQAAATREISRNVAETAAAAEEVSRRIAEVSHEADATGGRAAEVRDAADGLSRSVAELRDRLVRVVRDSLTAA